ncbi:MAG: hypothetical protein Q9191_006595 [Dirinaria sp. TL-2023a]
MAMSSSPPPPLEQSRSTGPDSDSEWEYEYSPTETETFYVTLDVTTHSSSLGRLLKKRIPYEKRKSKAVNAIADAQENGDETEAPVVPLEHDGLQLEAASPAQGESPAKVQILELHSENPLISYQGRVYSCTWSKPLGTDVLLKVPSSVLQGDLRDDTDEVSPIVAWSDLRLMAKPVELVPYNENRASKDNVLADGTHMASTITSMNKDESTEQASSTLQPSVQTREPPLSPRSPHRIATPDSPDRRSTSTDRRLTDQATTPSCPQPSGPTPNNKENTENHQETQSQRILAPTPSPKSLSDSARTSTVPNAPSVSQEVVIPATSAQPQQSNPPSSSPSQPFVQLSNTNNTVLRELSPKDQVSIPLADYNSVPRRNQASFLSRLIAAKRSRGETDDVTIYAKKSYYGSSWRTQQRATKEREASGVTLVEEDMNGNGDSGSSNEHGVPMSSLQRQARGRVRRVGFTENGKKIGRPRTEAFGSGRGRGRGRGRPRISRGGRGGGNAGAGNGFRRAETTAAREVQAMEASPGASPNRSDGRSLNVQEPGIPAGNNAQALSEVEGRTADQPTTLDNLNQE